MIGFGRIILANHGYMTDHKKNLETIQEARTKIASEINEIENVLNGKKELFLKYTGILEYLTSTEQAEAAETETTEEGEE